MILLTSQFLKTLFIINDKKLLEKQKWCKRSAVICQHGSHSRFAGNCCRRNRLSQIDNTHQKQTNTPKSINLVFFNLVNIKLIARMDTKIKLYNCSRLHAFAAVWHSSLLNMECHTRKINGGIALVLGAWYIVTYPCVLPPQLIGDDMTEVIVGMSQHLTFLILEPDPVCA